VEPVILTDIPFAPGNDEILTRFHLASDDAEAEVALDLAATARGMARPKAMYRSAYIEARDPGSVTIDGIAFPSRVLSVNLEPVHKVFPYVATCGVEMWDWFQTIHDPLESFWADTLMVMALRTAIEACARHTRAHTHAGPTSVMQPGSLEDWPLTQQAPLFALLGDPAAAVGVRLSESFLMIPTKSVSGLRFPSETGFENCQLCPREICPGRRAPYDSELYARKYSLSS